MLCWANSTWCFPSTHELNVFCSASAQICIFFYLTVKSGCSLYVKFDLSGGFRKIQFAFTTFREFKATFSAMNIAKEVVNRVDGCRYDVDDSCFHGWRLFSQRYGCCMQLFLQAIGAYFFFIPGCCDWGCSSHAGKYICSFILNTSKIWILRFEVKQISNSIIFDRTLLENINICTSLLVRNVLEQF